MCSVGGSVFSARGVLHFHYMSYLARFRDADFLWLYRARKKNPLCLSDLQVSNPLLADEVKQVTRYYCHGLERGHLSLYQGEGGGVKPRENVHSQDGPTVLTKILYCRIDVENVAIPSLHLQVTCDTHLPAPIDHEHKHISVIAENMDILSTTPGCIEHVLDEGDISFVMSDNTVCSADHLNVISYVVCGQELV